MPNMTKPAALGLLSSVLLLSGCSFLGSGSGYSAAPAHHGATTYSSGAHAAPMHNASYNTYTAAPVRTTYAPRTTYASAPTTIGHSAPYGTAVAHHGAAPAYGRPAMRGAFRPYRYGSLGAALYDIEGGAIGVQARAGYQLSQLIGAEIEGSVGIVDDTTTIGATTREAGLDYSIGGFGVARLPITPRMNIVGRAGYHLTDIEVTDTVGGVPTTVSGTEDGLAWGGGAEFAISPRDSIRVDYTNYDVPGSNLDSVSLGYQRKF